MDHSPRSHRRTLPSLLPLVGATLGLAGCNQYMLFNQAGYEQAAFSNEADILFVVDNSPSMAEETSALALNFNQFIKTLTSAEGSEPVTETLSDAVDNYVAYTQQRGRFLDYQLGITTTSVDYTGGTSDGADPGEAGLLVGAPIVKGEADVAAGFREQALCEAAYWGQADVQSDPSYTCGSGLPDVISQEYLDCVCGFGEWESNPSGSGDEEPLEAALMALCRASDDPPDACYHDLSAFEAAGQGANQGFLRDEGTVVVVIVSDEGDNSRLLAQGEDDPTVYLEAFEEFGKPVKFVAIGPGINPDTGGVICPSTSIPTWSLERVQNLTTTTGGFYRNIAVEAAGGCENSDFAQHLTDLGQLLVNLVTAFQLQSIPDVSTIRVWVDGEEIGPSLLVEGEADSAEAVWGDGWTYDSGQNAIVFWGTAIPDFNQDVEIFYRPLEGKPRDLPF